MCGCFLITGQKMNMSARVVFGKGRLAPKHLSFTIPQTDSVRKGNRPAGGKKRMFSFSIRCRLGIIRGRTTGKDDEVIWQSMLYRFCCLTSQEVTEIISKSLISFRSFNSGSLCVCVWPGKVSTQGF